jgi:hypothetical protein
MSQEPTKRIKKRMRAIMSALGNKGLEKEEEYDNGKQYRVGPQD